MIQLVKYLPCSHRELSCIPDAKYSWKLDHNLSAWDYDWRQGYPRNKLASQSNKTVSAHSGQQETLHQCVKCTVMQEDTGH